MQTETIVSARPSAHPSHLAVDPFSRELDLADLLSIVPAATRSTSLTTAILAAEPEPAPEPAPKSLNDLFTTYLQYERDIRNLFGEQSSREKLLFGPDWSPRVEAPSTQGIFRIASSAVSNLVALARNRYAPRGVTLDINQYDVLKAVGMDRWEDEYHRINRRSDTDFIPPVDLDKIWHFLEATYGGDAGIETAHRQNAKLIISEFRLDSDAEMKRTASSVSCFRRIYASKKTYGPNVGQYDFGHSSRDWLLQLFKGLACAFEWAELDQLSIELAPACHGICDYDFSFKSRDRTSFTGLDVVFFKEQMEFKFSHTAAEKLMLYLGTYGQPYAYMAMSVFVYGETKGELKRSCDRVITNLESKHFTADRERINAMPAFAALLPAQWATQSRYDLVSVENVADACPIYTMDEGSRDHAFFSKQAFRKPVPQLAVFGNRYGGRVNFSSHVDQVVSEGHVIRAVLLTRVNSDLPGRVLARVTSDVYDSNQRNIVIPKGSQLIGAYSSQIVVGQERLLMAMNRLILPNGNCISLTGAGAADMTGMSGVEADVNNYFMKMFGSSLVLGASTLFLSRQDTTVSTLQSTGGTASPGTAGSIFATSLNDVLKTLLDRNKQISPTLSLKEGEEFIFLVAHDMAMVPYRP